jgi:hypothetical protein
MSPISPTVISVLNHLELADAGDVLSSFSRPSRTINRELERSYVPPAPWPDGVVAVTDASKDVPIVFSEARPIDVVLSELVTFLNFEEGWDGDMARKPLVNSIHNAMAFVHLAGSKIATAEPSIHTNGEILLELEDDGEAGVLRFPGDNTVCFFIEGKPPRQVPFDGTKLPNDIKAAFGW